LLLVVWLVVRIVKLAVAFVSEADHPHPDTLTVDPGFNGRGVDDTDVARDGDGCRASGGRPARRHASGFNGLGTKARQDSQDR
jgi:hypothetical protein